MHFQLRNQLRETIAVKTETTADSYGDYSYSSGTNVAARIERHDAIVYNEAGEELKTTHRIITEAAITQRDRIWFPGDSSSTASLARTPRSIEKYIDENGATYAYVVLV